MREVTPWPEYWMSIAWKATERSKDPSTQVGVVIVEDDQTIVSTGYNGFPPGFPDTPEIWNDRPRKYDTVIHAEINAIARAAKKGRPTDGASLYTTHFPCLNCSKAVIAAGIKIVYFDKTVRGWDEEHKKARDLMIASGVTIKEQT